MSRRRRDEGVTLLELLFAAVVAALPLIVIMTLLGSNVRGTAHNRERVTVQLLLSNMVERYGRLTVDRLFVWFGDGSGGAEVIDRDAILNGSQAWTNDQLLAWGYRREAFLQLVGGRNVGAVLYLSISYRDVFGRLQRVGTRQLVGQDPKKDDDGDGGADGVARPTGGASDDDGATALARALTTSDRWAGGPWSDGRSRRCGAPDDGDGESWLAGRRPSRRSAGDRKDSSHAAVALHRLVGRLRAIDGRDGHEDYDWTAVAAPDENGGALDRVCALLRAAELPDGDYSYTFEVIDYRDVDPDFATAIERLELIVFVLDDRAGGRQRLLMLERHYDRRRTEPVCQFLDGAMLRDEGWHRLTGKDGSAGGSTVAGGCSAALTPDRLYVARAGRDPDGSVSDTACLMHVRRFDVAWDHEAQMAADAEGRGDVLDGELTRLFDALHVEQAASDPPAGNGRPFGL